MTSETTLEEQTPTLSGEVVPLINSSTRIKVSSTLDKSVGKKNLTDGSPETCWTSQQGLPQYIHVVFDSTVVPRRVHLTFQGGFVGKRCRIDVRPSGSTTDEGKPILKELTTIYPEDKNMIQSFGLEETEPVDQMKFVFEESSDFFGRITVYDLRIEGQLVSSGRDDKDT